MQLKATILFLMFPLLLSSKVLAQEPHPKLVTWQELAALPLAAADHKISYGPDSLQFGELRLPQHGKSKYPVVVLVHGGCWLSQYNLQYMSHLGQALTQAGYATWNIEFRRVGDEGGAYPGTFLDVAKAADHVQELAKTYPLDLKRVIVMGHSAGGHLALWLASRHKLPKSSPLYTPGPLKIRGVVSLAGITDLRAYSQNEGSCNSAVSKLMGGMPAAHPDLYAAASPIEQLPLRVPTRLVQGALDPIVPVEQAQRFTEQAREKGDQAQLILLEQAGHFDLVAPQSAAWPAILRAVDSLL
ncbi:MAG: alpha/beta hydrolase [Hymenobacteraceae bacterium]|nr:alpha/beta hydrolase [Hymenobacteraceae bacterium]MDX5481017.1 alpha/beta hydrolase [Hymenobacteraceae bacterium]